MPKKQNKETPKQQAARFRAEVARLIEAGELSPTDADDTFERIFGHLEAKRSEKGN